MKKVASILIMLLFYCPIFSISQVNKDWGNILRKVNAPIIVGKYDFEVVEGKLTGNKTLSCIIGYDSNYRILEYFEIDGLYLSHTYDSIGNEVEMYFYEKYDTLGKRTISAKYKNIYENGLVSKVDWFDFKNGEWIQESTTFSEYKFNEKGQIIEERYLLSKKYVSWIKYYEYDVTFNPEKKYYYNNDGNLYLPGCIKATSVDNKGDTTNIIYYQHLNDKVIEHKTITSTKLNFEFKNKYSNRFNIVEKHQYSSNEFPYWVWKFFIDVNGFETKVEWYENDWDFKNKLKNYYEYKVINK